MALGSDDDLDRGSSGDGAGDPGAAAEAAGAELRPATDDPEAAAEALEPTPPEPPDPPEPDATDVPPDLARTFWKCVLLSNVVTAAVTLGPLLIFFRGDWTLGSASLLLGAVLFGSMVREYRQWRRGRDDDPSDRKG